MRENINKVSQRGERLDALQDKTTNLAITAQDFRRKGNSLRKKFWLKDMRMRICIGIGIAALLAVIIVPSGKISYSDTRCHQTCSSNRVCEQFSSAADKDSVAELPYDLGIIMPREAGLAGLF